MKRLFTNDSVHGYLGIKKSQLEAEVENCNADYLLKVSESEYQEYLVKKYLVTAPQLLEDQIYQDEPTDSEIETKLSAPKRTVSGTMSGRPMGWTETHYDKVPGTAITISLPFSGEAALLKYKPSSFTLNPPRGEVVSQEIKLRYEFVHGDTNDLKSEFENDLESIKKYLEWISGDVSGYNQTLSQVAETSIRKRKQKLLADREASVALGLPIKRRDDAPQTFVVPEVRRKVVIPPKVATDSPSEPEPALPESEYDHILSIIQNMVSVMERSPGAFVSMDEESLRQHFLVQLNGQYEGQATGETFNYTGKTDILIRADGKNIFVAECKFWTGPAGLVETIDQILGYLSWRDTKTAIVLFNQNKNFSRVVNGIPAVVKEHQCYRRFLKQDGESNFRYVFHQPNDPDRELILTIMAFDVPTNPAKERKPQ